MNLDLVKITAIDDENKTFSGIGRLFGEFTKRPFLQQFGFASYPAVNSYGLVLIDGEQSYLIATECEKSTDKPTVSSAKDTLMYSDANKYIKLKTSGDIEVKNNNNTITLKANGDIELGASTLKTLVHSTFLTLYNAHVHPTTTPGSPTGVPSVASSEALHCTLKVKGQ